MNDDVSDSSSILYINALMWGNFNDHSGFYVNIFACTTLSLV